MSNVELHIILITGTSSGYGKATAQLFLDQGWNDVATMRAPDESVFDKPGDRLKVLPLDVTSAESISKALADAVAAFGRIDVLVNNAGIGLLSAFEFTPDTVIREMFETNTFGVMAVCRAAIPHMRQHAGGVIINVTSSTAIAPMPFVAVYTASKCAVEGFTEALSYELGLVGIRARIVEPGLAPTTNFRTNSANRIEGLTPPPYDAFAQRYFAKLQDYPTAFTSVSEVSEAVFAAATEEGDRLRFPAGPDTALFAQLRWMTSEEHYLAQMRAMFGPDLSE